MRSFADPETHFRLVESGTPKFGSDDGLAKHEPKFLECAECDARVRIDGPDGHQTTIDELGHDRDCPNRGVKSRYWEAQYVK